jgi:hypothetical protein
MHVPYVRRTAPQVHDIAMMPDQRKLIGCSFSTAFVGLWVVDLQQASGGRSEGVRVCVCGGVGVRARA